MHVLDSNAGNAEIDDSFSGIYSYSDTDGDGEGDSTFRWLRNGVVITGETSQSYSLTTEDIGAALSFEVTPRATIGANPGMAISGTFTPASPELC
ncbi:MAG: hypothetical protein JKX83_00460 [Pseudomonadales bacterium]|nr:hypothetical protein [Pseudomonadales bacterium]